MTARSSVPAAESLPDPTQASLLGLLALRDWTTYELANQMKRSISWFWDRAERTLYQEPKRLVEAGWAISRTEHTGRRPATVYRITPAGRDALRAWLDTHGGPPILQIENLIRVFFADQGDPDQLRGTVEHMGAQARESRAELLDIAASMDLDDPVIRDRRAVNALSIGLILDVQDAVIRWADWAAAVTEHWDSTTEPGWDGGEIFDAPEP